MPADRFFIFEKRCEAFAFADGVEWANDSAIEFMEVCRLSKIGFVARFLVNDKPEDESDPYPATWTTGRQVDRKKRIRTRGIKNGT